MAQVKRVIKEGGKFICLTLGESHVLGMFFPKFRYGWKINIHLLPQNPSKNSNSSLRTFLVVAEKASPTTLQTIPTSFQRDTLGSGDQTKADAFKYANQVLECWYLTLEEGNDKGIVVLVSGDQSKRVTEACIRANLMTKTYLRL